VRVLLVSPSTVVHSHLVKTYATFPNGILYIAAVLETHGHQVQIYDNSIDGRQPKDFIPFSPDIVGFSVLTGPNMDAAIAQSIEFKRIMPWVKIIWGNVHPSVLPEQTLIEPYIDYVVIGAGEYTLLELVEHLENGHMKLSEIKGLAYKENGKVTINEPRPFIENLDELPDPAWHLVDVNKYWDITINTSRGCPFHCTFCYNTAFHKGYLAELPAERIVSQIEHLKKRYGVKYIKIWEDNFTSNRKRLRQFCNLLISKKLKIKWDTEARADLKEEDIALMAKSGCVSVGSGLESGSQRILDFLQKGTTVEEMEKTFWLFIKYKILARLYLMVGLPTETVEDFKLTHELLERLDEPPYTYMRYVPYPGTPLFDYCVANGLVTPPEKLGDWGNFTVMCATKFNLSNIPQEMIEEAAANFSRTYAVRPLRFAMKHHPSYFLSLIRDPLAFSRTLRNLVRYYLMILFSSSSRMLKSPPKTSCVNLKGETPNKQD